MYLFVFVCIAIVLTKLTAAQNEPALSYHRVRGLYFLVSSIFAATIHVRPTF